MALKAYWTKELIFEALRRWEEEHGKLPTSLDWKKQPPNGRKLKLYPTSRYVAKTFGSWRGALEEYRKPKKRWKLWSQEEIVEALQRWAEEEGRPPTYRDVSRGDHGGRLPSVTSLRRWFGGFGQAMKAAGLPVLPHGVTHKSVAQFRPLPRKGDR